MSLAQELQKQYDVGFPIFEKLFKLNKVDLITVMKDIFQDNKQIIEVLVNNPVVIKTLKDDEPTEIKICVYDTILINYTGISFQPEHSSWVRVLKFDYFFNVDLILNRL